MKTRSPYLTLTSLAVLLCTGALAADERDYRQALLDVGTDIRLMCLAAHPDDEDGATLARYRKRFGVRTFAVIATRGEGGQNETGPELYEDLAVIRTHEMMRAADITGAELRFLNLPEFGYSKSREETFNLWGRDETLRRLVRVIREVRPDVIITHHDPHGGHGHHQAVGTALLEAFDAAADPERFPEQVADDGLKPWKTARLFVRTGQDSLGAVTVDIAAQDPIYKESYAEIAARALEEHRSQGMGYFTQRLRTGKPQVYYNLVREAVFPDLGEPHVPAPPGVLTAGLTDRVTSAERALSTADPASADLLGFLENRKRDTIPEARRTRIERAAALACGLGVKLRIHDADAIFGPQQSVTLTATFTDLGPPDADTVVFRIESAPWISVRQKVSDSSRPGNGAWAAATVSVVNGRAQTALNFRLPADLPPTVPHAEHVFDDTFLQPPFTLRVDATCRGRTIGLRIPVHFDTAPSVGIAFRDAPYLVRIGTDETVRFRIDLTNYAPTAADASLVLSPSPGFRLENQIFPVAFTASGERATVDVEAKIHTTMAPRTFYVTAMIQGDASARHAPIHAVDLQVPQDIRVGVVQSYDDTFVNTLEALGVPHETIGDDDFQPDRLDTFSTVIIDIRAYLVREDLIENNPAILAYVQRGGTLLVMYQKTFEWKEEFAPYPLRLSHNRVTREDAPISLLVPDHPLFNTPNPIHPGDWNGWRQERGLYFPDRWDPRYTPLVACADPGEDPPPGSCLIAQYGSGQYFYTALGWYRQLRERHPGALRIFANMLAL